MHNDSVTGVDTHVTVINAYVTDVDTHLTGVD